MVMNGAPFLTMMFETPSLLALFGPEEFDLLATWSRSLKNALADAFLALWLRDHGAVAALA